MYPPVSRVQVGTEWPHGHSAAPRAARRPGPYRFRVSSDPKVPVSRSPDSRFGREPEPGSRGRRRAGDFGVRVAGSQARPGQASGDLAWPARFAARRASTAWPVRAALAGPAGLSKTRPPAPRPEALGGPGQVGSVDCRIRPPQNRCSFDRHPWAPSYRFSHTTGTRCTGGRLQLYAQCRHETSRSTEHYWQVSYDGLAGEAGSCVSMKISWESQRLVVGSSLRHEVKLTSRSCSGRQCRSASLALPINRRGVRCDARSHDGSKAREGSGGISHRRFSVRRR